MLFLGRCEPEVCRPDPEIDTGLLTTSPQRYFGTSSQQKATSARGRQRSNIRQIQFNQFGYSPITPMAVKSVHNKNIIKLKTFGSVSGHQTYCIRSITQTAFFPDNHILLQGL